MREQKGLFSVLKSQNICAIKTMGFLIDSLIGCRQIIIAMMIKQVEIKRKRKKQRIKERIMRHLHET